MEGRMFDVMVDSKIINVRDSAKAGNLDSMVCLGAYLRQGWHTRQNPDLAMRIFDHVLTQKDKIAFPDTLWNALAQKAYIHHDRREEEVVDQLFTELVKSITSHPAETWDFGKLEEAINWLSERHEIKTADAEQ